jgi:TP901 family phage tail tape measure protein
MADRTIAYRFKADAGQLKRELASAGTSVKGLGDRLSHADRGMRRFGGSARSSLRPIAAGIAAIGVGRLIKESVQLEATFSRTMAQVQVAAGASGRQMRDLDRLAQKMGADTAFSANEAADAMLNLAKGGLSPAQIQAGALKNTMTLATAGGLDLATAGNTVVKTMGAFGLSAKQTGAAVSALAGAANASSADVSDISQALSQAGTSAKTAGLSVQETTGILAAFADQGIQGSDAGTGLRTMLTRLVPQTKSAKDEMKRLGLSFTTANGEFVSATQIAQRLQNTYKDMSAAERTRSLQTIFGADAQRAANVLISEGSSGLAKYITQTSDLSQAQKLADAAMSGTAGSLERLSGSVDTAKLQIGKGLAPVIRDMADRAGRLAASGDLEKWARNAGRGFSGFVDDVTPLAKSLTDLGQSALPVVRDGLRATNGILGATVPLVKSAVDSFNSMPAGFKKIVLGAGATAYVASKVPGVNLGSLLARGATSAVTGGVQKVFVTNPGFGAGGLGGVGGTAGKAGKAAKAGAFLGRSGGALATLAVGSMVVHGTKSMGGRALGGFVTGAIAGGRIAGAPGAVVGGIGGGLTGALTTRDQNNPQWAYASAAAPKNAKNVKAMAQAYQVLQREQEKLTGGLNREQLAWSKTHGGPVKENIDKMAALQGKLARATGLSSAEVKRQVGTLAQQGKGVSTAAMNMDKFVFDANRAGISTKQLSAAMNALPQAVQVKLATPGAVKSKADVMALARQFGLTPRQIRIMMALVGAKKAQKETDDTRTKLGILHRTNAKPKITPQGYEAAERKRRVLSGGLSALNNTRAKPKVTVDSGQAVGTLSRIRGLMGGIHDKTVTFTTIRRDIRVGASKGTSANPTHNATGGRIVGPGTATSDSIPAMLSNGEFVIRTAAVQKYGESFFQQANAMRLAGGGPVGSSLPGGGTGIDYRRLAAAIGARGMTVQFNAPVNGVNADDLARKTAARLQVAASIAGAP